MKSLNRAAIAVLLIALALLLPAGALLWLRLASPSDGARGEAIFGPAVAQRLMNFFRDLGGASRPAAPPLAFPELTDREREILNLIAQGHNNTEIAERLTLSPKTVRNHVSNIFSKLQVADRAQAIVRAREAGLGAGH